MEGIKALAKEIDTSEPDKVQIAALIQLISELNVDEADDDEDDVVVEPVVVPEPVDFPNDSGGVYFVEIKEFQVEANGLELVVCKIGKAGVLAKRLTSSSLGFTPTLQACYNIPVSREMEFKRHLPSHFKSDFFGSKNVPVVKKLLRMTGSPGYTEWRIVTRALFKRMTLEYRSKKTFIGISVATRVHVQPGSGNQFRLKVTLARSPRYFTHISSHYLDLDL